MTEILSWIKPSNDLQYLVAALLVVVLGYKYLPLWMNKKTKLVEEGHECKQESNLMAFGLELKEVRKELVDIKTEQAEISASLKFMQMRFEANEKRMDQVFEKLEKLTDHIVRQAGMPR